jgi:hypothetical protein
MTSKRDEKEKRFHPAFWPVMIALAYVVLTWLFESMRN